MKKYKSISNKHLRSLNAKSNQVGLDTHEVLQVLDRLITDDSIWKNKSD